MPLTATPVTAADIGQLEQGIMFSQTSAANQALVAGGINAPGSTTSVFTYAAQLLNSQISLAQVTMADTALMELGTVGVGDTATPNTLTFLSTQFLPAQVAVAASLGLNQTVYAAETLGLAVAGTTAFKTNFATLTTSQFVSQVSTATGVGSSFIQGFVTFWLGFYGGIGSAAVPPGYTVQQAAYGAAFGDATGAALLAPPSLNLPLTTVISTNAAVNSFAPNTIAGSVANALIDNAEGKYTTGVALAALPVHQPLQGEATAAGAVFTLSPGVDTVVLNKSGSTVIGVVGGANPTWSAGDTITAAAGTTNQIFNLTGAGAAGSVTNVTGVGPGNTVSGIQTVNVQDAVRAVQGDFTTTGPEGAWTGLTALNVISGGNATGADLLTVAATTAVQLTDTLLSTTTNPLTVNGSLTTTITENNGAFVNGGITVNGGSGTTTVSITQTEAVAGNDGIVTIMDANGAPGTTAAGTITKITLDGLSHFNPNFTSGPNVIIDNALTNLTVNHSDLLAGGVGLAIIDNLTTPTATTLTLSLGADGVDAAGAAVPGTQLVIADVKAEYSTIHLSLGAQNSFANIIDNGLTTLDTPTAGTGALVGVSNGFASEINSSVAAAVKFDFSGLNGPNDIEVNRLNTNNADVFTLGNFGTDNQAPTTEQQLVITNGNPANVATINFGSGAYMIAGPGPHGVYNYVNTAANGAGLNNFATLQQWADIGNAKAGDTLLFKGDTVQNLFQVPGAVTIATGIADALAQAPHTATFFNDAAGDTFVYDRVGTGANIAPGDAMVEIVGAAFHFPASTLAAGLITFHP